MFRFLPTTINHFILLMGLTLMIVPVWIIFASSTHTSLFINTNGLQFFLGDSFKENYSSVLFKKAGFFQEITALKMFLGIVGALPEMGGVREAAEARAGVILSDRMELAFKGTPKRVFSYTFKMIPKNNKEAIEIRNIVKAFKFNMLPEFEDGNITGRKLTVPNTFDISYMFVGKQNEYLHKIGTCVLENMNVQYGGDRYTAYEPDSSGSPPPQRTSISLKFSELELMYRNRIEDGF